MITGIAAVAPIHAATICVNPAGTGGCKATIGAAVTAAASGDTILVSAGTYKESITIGKPLSLVGVDPAKAVIDATGLDVGINVNGIDNKGLTGVLISGLSVLNAKFEGILITNSSNVTVSGNILSGNDAALAFGPTGPTCPGIPSFETAEDFDCGEAIHLSGVDHSAITGNTVTGNAGGILLSDDTGATHDNTISGNNVSDNQFDCGITLASHPPAAIANSTTALGVYHNSIVGNTAARNGLKGEGGGVGIFASAPGTATYGNLVLNNVLTGNDLPGVAMHGHTPNQNLNDNVIIGNQISGNGPDTDDAATPGTAGIIISGISPITGTIISGNAITKEQIAVAIFAPGEARVHSNSFTGGGIGVANLGRGGVVNADGNYWGCAANPANAISAISGCAITSGAVNLTYYLPPPAK